MQLSVILALLGSMLAAQAAPSVALPDMIERSLLCALLVALVTVAGRIVAGAAVTGLQGGLSLSEVWPDRYRRLRTVHTLAWGAAIVAIYCGLGWPQIVRENWGLKHAILLDDLLILLPVVISLVLSWWALGAAEQALECRTAARNGRTPRTVGGMRGALLLARHLVAPVLAPVLLVVGAQDLTARYAAGASVTAANVFLTLPLLLVAVVGFPWVLRYLWRTEPLTDGALRNRLRIVEQRLGVRTRDILVWHTDRTICNAAVAGIFPGCRYVFLSDVLLERLSPQEIAAVYAHELGHVRHGHLLLRLLIVVLPLVLWRSITATFPTALAPLSETLNQLGWSPTALAGLLTLILAAAYALLVFSWYCRVLEREADLCGCQGITDPNNSSDQEVTPEGAEHFVSALATLAALTQSSRQANRPSWLHPALLDRIAFVRHMAGHPADREQFGGRMRRLARLLLAMVAVLTLWPLVVELLRQ